jgi:FKBP-type peptidyl-prolyl cis-trans isomerase
MKGLQKGDRFTLLVPSRLAYADEGIRDPATSKWIIAPNTPLVFEIKIVNVEDAPPVSGR